MKRFLLVLVGCAVILIGSASAATRSSRAKTPKTPVEKLEQKLNQVEQNEQQLLEKFNTLMEELRAVKFRVSR